MAETAHCSFVGECLITGRAYGKLLATNTELSFWGGVDQKTGEVIDRFHPLSGASLKDTVLAIPGSRGSCGGSVVIMELILNGLGPKALVFERFDGIITLGALVAEEFFGKTIPIVVLSQHDFEMIQNLNQQTVYIQDGRISNMPLNDEHENDIETETESPHNAGVHLSKFDRELLSGVHGEAAKISIRILIRAAGMMGATELMDITRAHVDGAWYGPGTATFAERLQQCGGRFRIPATTNAINIDQQRWRILGVEAEYGKTNDKLANTYLEMGAQSSFTCAPYLLENIPSAGDTIAWTESNAIAYANSVLGARTLKNPNMLECLIALTGRAPRTGVYLDSNRLASVWIRAPAVREADDAFWPILGYSIGVIAKSRIPVITGLETTKPSRDDLKAFSAAFATSSGAPMFHVVNITHEASSLEAACPEGEVPAATDLDLSMLQACWKDFNYGSSSRKVNLVSLGNPHLSLNKIKILSKLCHGRTKHSSVAVIVTCGRSQYGLASQAGYIGVLERFGVQFLTDTCWCFIKEPVIPEDVQVIMTNSGKYIHYGPGLTGRQFCFGNLAMCVEAACIGKSTVDAPRWLQMVEPY